MTPSRWEPTVGVARSAASIQLTATRAPSDAWTLHRFHLSRPIYHLAWAQSTSSPPQIQPPAKTAPTQASHSSRSSVQQFKTETDAKSHCGTDQVVWGNMGSHVLHDAGTKTMGRPHTVPTCAKALQLMRAITKPRNKKPSQFNAGKRRRGVERHFITFCLCRLPSTLQPVQPSPYTVRP